MRQFAATERRTIAFLTRSLAEGTPITAWGEMVDFAQERDVNLLLIVGRMLQSTNVAPSPNTLYQLVSPNSTDGVIISGGLGHYVGVQSFQDFCEPFAPLPVVCTDTLLDKYPGVTTDFYGGMRKLMQHLIHDHGYRRIAFICGSLNSAPGEDRYRAYTDSLSEAGLPFDQLLVAPGDFFAPSGENAIRLLVNERRVQFDALVAANDDMAIDAMQALQSHGFRVPDDIAVAGFDDLVIARSMVPPLTTVHLSAGDETRSAAEVLLAILDGEPVQHRVHIPSQLIIRQSCGCKSAALAAFETPSRSVATSSQSTLEESSTSITAHLVRSCNDTLSPAENSMLGKWHDVFVNDLQGNTGQFKSFLTEFAALPRTSRISHTIWQSIISVHRRHVLPLVTDPNELQRAENLWQYARVFLAESALNIEAQWEFRQVQLDAVLRSVGENLITTFDLKGLGETIARDFTKLGITACYVAVYAQSPAVPNGIPEHTRLILAYNENGMIALPPEGCVFTTGDILPPEYFPTRCVRSTLAVLPLQFRDEHFGYVVFKIGPLNGFIYETLSLHLSSAVKGALLVEQMKDLYNEALLAKTSAEQANRLKTQLLANVSHELRTPINVILSYSRFALDQRHDSEVTPELRADIEHIHDSGQHLIRLINDLLDLSRADIGELDLYPETIAPRQFLEQTFRTMLDSSASAPGVTWKLELPPRLPVIQADPTRLRQIIFNLLSNASKFTDEGEIVLGAEVVPPHFHIWVRDTGYGIPIDQQERIFEPFFSESQVNHRPEGIGLGLTITRRLIALHGGSLLLESQPGNGSIFHIYLPLPNLSGRVNEVATPQGNQKQRSVLLISALGSPPLDFVNLARKSNAETVIVSSIEAMNRAIIDAQPIVLAWDMDHARPGDWLIIQHARNHARLCQIPFILYRDRRIEGDVGGAELTNVLLKPLSMQNLADLIQSLAPLPAGEPILVVDDDAQAREIYLRLLSERFAGYPVVMAENGEVALELLKTVTPSLILLDLSMPKVDGFRVLEEVRSSPRMASTPIVVLTGRLLSFEDIKRLDYGNVVLQFKNIHSDEELVLSIQQVFDGETSVPQHSSQLVKQALAYIQQNFAYTLSRAEIASAVGVSEDYLSRIFGREMGIPPWEYLNRYRILQAKHLLVQSNMNITRIASEVGFEDPAYFSRVFQKIAGSSPRDYRLLQRSLRPPQSKTRSLTSSL
ncbi:MAG TPA: substrate-binding domain-containing protein [Aggregatilineales bacterium]|nr:substrate-binding domain-containing protein [Aggregatilineales bacterium]